MAGQIKLQTSAGGGVVLDTATTTATDVTVKVPVTGVNNGTLICSDSSGNVGIGTISPAAKLHVAQNGGGAVISAAAASAANVYIAGNGNTAGSTSFDLIQDATTVYVYNRANTPMVFGTNNAEKMRIDSSGNLLVGATSAAGSEKLGVTSTSNNAVARFHNDATSGSVGGIQVRYRNLSPNNTSNQFLYCDDFNGLRAEIRSNGGLVNYSANNGNLSDVRTKTDIQDAGNYLEKICAIPVRTFRYKDQTDNELNLGAIAQEVEAVAPELVDTSGFGKTPEDGVPLKAIYQTDLQYALMKCIQELSAKNDALEARIAALEAK